MSDIAVLICLSCGEPPPTREAIRSGPRVNELDPKEMVAGLEPGPSNIDNVTDNDVMKMKYCRLCTIANPNVIDLARAVTCNPTPLSDDECPGGGRFRQTRPNGRKNQETCQTGMTKPSKNTPQQINIALIDKPARSSRNLNIDLLEMIGTASTQPYRFQSFRIHPNYLPNNLPTQLDYPLRRVQPAEEINTTLPAHLARRVQEPAEHRQHGSSRCASPIPTHNSCTTPHDA